MISNAEVAQLVEHQLPKLRVAGSSPVFRSKLQESTSEQNACAFFVAREPAALAPSGGGSKSAGLGCGG